ncbi:MAG TPA: efflux RND transporter permease subunit [Candidatus Kapabacteria bacterium]|nr:efflux RND transporter permease subunit [Candidatus Kapabacteria bacterium]
MSELKAKYFKPTNWAIDHKIPVYFITVAIIVIGLFSYIQLPKEQFPDIVIPTIIVQTVYPGNSPGDIENLITRPIEKQLKGVNGIKKVSSSSLADVSVVVVEFNTKVDQNIAKQRVADAVDKARSDLPTDLDMEPQVQEVNFSEFPIMYVNIYGDVEPQLLKNYADELQDKIEGLKEITRVDIVGALEREFQVDLDLYKMNAAGVSFNQVENAIAAENVNISGGEVVVGNYRRNIRLISQFKSVKDIQEIKIKVGSSYLALKDIADIKDDFKEQLNFARLNKKQVISLNVIKRAGENLINAADKINEIVKDYDQNRLPKGVKIEITGDMSIATRTNLADLINSVVIGFVLVVLVLMFFLGVRDSIFVGLSVPIASFLAFVIMPTLGYSFNVVVTFAFLLSLGIIVDDAIVVIENTHRIHNKFGIEIKEAARIGAGEVFVPVLAGTLTTLAPFVPLLFFPGIMGEFIYYLPAILIITLSASLLVAYLFNSVLASQFMHIKEGSGNINNMHKISVVMILIGIIAHLASNPFLGNLIFFLVIIAYLNRFIITPYLIKGFQNRIQPVMMNAYRKILEVAIRGKNAYYFTIAAFLLLIVSFVIFGMFPPKVSFFVESDPNQIYAYIEMPIGTNAIATDSVSKEIEKKVYRIIGDNNPDVSSVITNVGIGAGDPNNPDRAVMPHKAKITINFVEFHKRKGKSTSSYLSVLRDEIKDLPGIKITIDKERNGPPTGKPVNVEISGDNFDELLKIEKQFRDLINKDNIQGIEKLSSDLVANKPEILLEVDKDKANSLGISSAYIGMMVRNAVYGKEASKFKDDKDDYPVQVRLSKSYRDDISSVLNMTLVVPANNGSVQIPLSSVVKVSYINSFASINRKNQKRTLTLSSNVLEGYTATEINAQLQSIAKRMDIEEGYTINFTGEQENQQETTAFLGQSFIVSLFLIMIILVTQFNSISKPIIIISQVVLSTIGVLLGFTITRQSMSIVFTGIGIVALAGIVVRNGIVLIDFIEEYHSEVKGSIRKAIVLGGVTRFNPVVLTASATMLGLVPLAIGFNINFITLFESFEPNIYIGGDSTQLWSSLAWTIVFGLGFATFMTLIIVPALYFINYAASIRLRRFFDLRKRHSKKK